MNVEKKKITIDNEALNYWIAEWFDQKLFATLQFEEREEQQQQPQHSNISRYFYFTKVIKSSLIYTIKVNIRISQMSCV